MADAQSGPGTSEPSGTIAGFAKGFGLTFSTMFKHVYTQQYPFDIYPTAPRYHGPRAHSASRRTGEVRRLRVVRVCMPAGGELCGGRRHHRYRAVLAG